MTERAPGHPSIMCALPRAVFVRTIWFESSQSSFFFPIRRVHLQLVIIGLDSYLSPRMPPNLSTPKVPPGVTDNNNIDEHFSKESAIAYWNNVIAELQCDLAKRARPSKNWNCESLSEHSTSANHYVPNELDSMGAPPCSSTSFTRGTPSVGANSRESRLQRREERRSRNIGFAIGSEERAAPLRRLNRNPFVSYATIRDAAKIALHKTIGTDVSSIAQSLTTPRSAMKAITNMIREEARPQLLGVDLTERNLRMLTNETYTKRLKEINEEYQKTIDELAIKMINELEEEQRLIEAQLKAMDGNGDIKHLVHYAPKKELRRRNAAGVTERTIPELNSTLIGAFAPIHKTHWIDPIEIEADMNVVNKVLGSEAPVYKERHKRIVLTADKLCLDGRKHSRYCGYVTLHTIDRGDIAAFLISNNENCLTYRAVSPGDTRVVCVTIDDLITGRVRITKRIMNSNSKREEQPSEAEPEVKKPHKRGRGRKNKL